MIKRDCERKDASATVVPGFGGVLDVIDSLIFAGPVAYRSLALVWALIDLSPAVVGRSGSVCQNLLILREDTRHSGIDVKMRGTLHLNLCLHKRSVVNAVELCTALRSARCCIFSIFDSIIVIVEAALIRV